MGRVVAEEEPNIVTHIGIILDASDSMRHLKAKLIEVVDNLIKHLAAQSQQMDQETRVSIWIFSGSHQIRCVVWDKDVLRLPSIAKYYDTLDMTAFIDAAMKSFADMKTTSQIYGEHSFLLYFVTDGYENASRKHSREDLKLALKGLPDNFTTAALVPNEPAATAAKVLGFPAGNVQIWDATSTEGLEKASQSIQRSADAYMTSRSTFSQTGFKSTNTLFDMSASAVNAATIQAAGLTPLNTNEYVLIPVVFKPPFRDGDDWISTFTERQGYQYVAGRGYYQLTLAPVKVQVNKDVAIVEKKSGLVYTGKNARALLGLPNMTVTLKAGQNPDYDIFVQSTSPNRKLLVGSKYLYLPLQNTYAKPQVPPAKTAPKVAKMPLAPVTVARRAAAKAATVSTKTKVDLDARVYPKGGKALWAAVACPVCAAIPNRRCLRTDNGKPMEKPHAQRKA